MAGTWNNRITNQSSSSSGLSDTSNGAPRSALEATARITRAPRTRRGRPPMKRDNAVLKKGTILAWLIDCRALQENMTICYLDNRINLPLVQGTITRDGILCRCCSQIFTAETFQAHAGGETSSPYEKIFIKDTTTSILSLMIRAWNDPAELTRRRFNVAGSIDDYDDACLLCADGGNLICCEDCPSTYHLQCLEMEAIPENSWRCTYCICKFCANPAPENDPMLTCTLCDRKFHWDCYLQEEGISIDLNTAPGATFCGQSCREVHELLEKLIGVRNNLDDGYTWSILRRTEDEEPGVGLDDVCKRAEQNSKLSIVRAIMKHSFESIFDRHTGIDVIQSVVYNCGSNYNRINFRGFYTTVLEKDSEIISMASIRIHGTNLAEMPFIATSESHRRKGMCRKLLTAIESALRFLKVRYLVIPSADEKKEAWINNYNFSELEETVKKDIMCTNALMFHDSLRLQKALLPPDNT